ncbi:MAG TPA: YdeI/OmpD-associated family protein [Anaerolineae bacterium]|nr:YdeI/OmpD-associated family protein [Anaerolineae bacterium]
MAGTKRFHATLETDDGSAAFVKIPFAVKAVFGAARPPVRVTLNGYEFQSTLTPYGGMHYLGVNQKVRAAAGVKIGDRVEVTLAADEAPRTIKPPVDLARALKANPAAQARWRQLSFTHQKEYVAAIEDAKKPETRARRIEKTIEQLAGKSSTRSKQA